MHNQPDDRPTSGEYSRSRNEMLRIVTHPAMRLGFLDAMAGKPLDHFRIIERIFSETPSNALRRLGWSQDDVFGLSRDHALAEWRYEEGRLLVIDQGLRCRAWGHPDYPPRQVLRWIEQKAAKDAA